MTTVNRDSLRDDFDGYMADIDSLRKEGEITENAAETITGLCDMMKLVMVVFLEKTSKNSSIPPSQTDKDETKKAPGKNHDTSKEENSKTGGNFETVTVEETSTVRAID